METNKVYTIKTEVKYGNPYDVVRVDSNIDITDSELMNDLEELYGRPILEISKCDDKEPVRFLTKLRPNGKLLWEGEDIKDIDDPDRPPPPCVTRIHKNKDLEVWNSVRKNQYKEKLYVVPSFPEETKTILSYANYNKKRGKFQDYDLTFYFKDDKKQVVELLVKMSKFGHNKLRKPTKKNKDIRSLIEQSLITPTFETHQNHYENPESDQFDSNVSRMDLLIDCAIAEEKHWFGNTMTLRVKFLIQTLDEYVRDVSNRSSVNPVVWDDNILEKYFPKMERLKHTHKSCEVNIDLKYETTANRNFQFLVPNHLFDENGELPTEVSKNILSQIKENSRVKILNYEDYSTSEEQYQFTKIVMNENYVDAPIYGERN